MTEDLAFNNSVTEDFSTTLNQLLSTCLSFESSDSLSWSEEEQNCAAEKIFAANSHFYHSSTRCFWRHLCCNMYSNLNHQCVLNGNICIGSYISDDSVVSDNVLEEHGRISLAYENLKSMPKRLTDKYASHTRVLDLSYNNFRNISFLAYFNHLHTLILDRNYKIDVKTVPYIPSLKILWINNCDIKSMVEWIRSIRKQFPALEQLSVMGNPGLKFTVQYCLIDLDENLMPTLPIYGGFRTKPNNFTDYREFILGMLPNLQYLDGIPREKTLLEIENLKNDSLSSHSSSGANQCQSLSNSQSNSNSISNSNNSNNQNKSLPLSFRNIFRLKRRKSSVIRHYREDTSTTD